jgi:hypothetical protein
LIRGLLDLQAVRGSRPDAMPVPEENEGHKAKSGGDGAQDGAGHSRAQVLEEVDADDGESGRRKLPGEALALSRSVSSSRRSTSGLP